MWGAFGQAAAQASKGFDQGGLDSLQRMSLDQAHQQANPFLELRPGQVWAAQSAKDTQQMALNQHDPLHALRYNDHKVYWEGWETTTARLARSGWDIAVNYQPEYLAYRLFFNHKSMTLSAMTEERSFQELLHRGMPFKVSVIAPRIQVQVAHARTMSAEPGQFVPIDASIMQREVQEINPDNIFLRSKDEQELLVDSANMEVVDHLEAIKELQSEKQKELRERHRRQEGGLVQPDGIPERNVIANVVELRVA
jgi:hypothetical protein